MRVQLSGRLGNQLFEFAHAIELSKNSGTKLNLIWDEYSYPNGLGDDLSVLGLNYLKKSNSIGLILKILDKVKKHSSKFEYLLCRVVGFYREGQKKKTRKVRVITGFYQDYRWAEKRSFDIQELVKKAKALFQFEIDELNLPINYQVIHYRCGDYLGHPGNFGVLSVEYYRRNLDRKLPVLILTDSYDRALEKFGALGHVRVISPNECNAWAALIVMSEARLVISSNSTLSWWGSFLAVKKGGRAVIPQPFFANGNQTSLFHPDFAVSESIFEAQNE
jgi:hypothetical protein